MKKDMINNGLDLGVDGCRGGWIAAVLDHGKLRFEKFSDMSSLIDVYPDFDAFLIDMVIGLRGKGRRIQMSAG